MKTSILKIISGGQTGADMAGLIAAKAAGIRTGGCAPKGYLTEVGPNPKLRSEYGLHQSDSDKYPKRTAENVSKSDCTIIFGNKDTRGSALTITICDALNKPYIVIPASETEAISKISGFIYKLKEEKNRALIVNIAGNRESKNPGTEARVTKILSAVFSI
jgi:hypothetical protein